MKMKITSVVAIVTIMLLSVQEMKAQFTLSAELRPRTEYQHGYKDLVIDSSINSITATSQRTRLNFNYDHKNFRIGISAQDVRTWGDVSTLNAANSFFTMHEAWAEIDLVKNLKLKTGRQEVVYDDHRMFGNVGWAQQGRSHDLMLLKYEDDFKIHGGFAQNISDNAGYKYMHYVWAHKTFDLFGISLLYLKNMYDRINPELEELKRTLEDQHGELPISDYFWHKFYTKEPVQTFGGRFTSKTIRSKDTTSARAFNLNANVYFQTGTNISAYLIGGDASFTITDDITLVASYEQQSGNDLNPYGDDYLVNRAFNPFFGTNHKFNGNMDYFYAGNHIQSVGLEDISAGIKYKKDKLSINLIWHLFNAVGNIGDGLGQRLGNEIDISAGFALSEMVDIKMGYSMMFATEALAAVKEKEWDDLEEKLYFERALKGREKYEYLGMPHETNDWAWVMITVKPTLFKSKSN